VMDDWQRWLDSNQRPQLQRLVSEAARLRRICLVVRARGVEPRPAG
jgi:hypothetical protein